MPRLNDTQTILLSTAAQREGGSVYPLPDTIRAGARVDKTLTALLGADLVAERPCHDTAAAFRTDGDLSFGLFITDAGLAAIGIEPAGEGEGKQIAPHTPEPRQTKAALLLSLVSREEGATLAELIAATGWLPHTTRAALTGLRKKGHALERGTRDGATCYSVKAAA